MITGVMTDNVIKNTDTMISSELMVLFCFVYGFKVLVDCVQKHDYEN